MEPPKEILAIDTYRTYLGDCSNTVIRKLFDNSRWSEAGCFEWAWATNKKGYGIFALEGVGKLVHKAGFLVLKGPILQGHQIHHTCENKRCWYMGHLKEVTPHENVMASDTVNRRNALKTHCSRGHEFTEENTYIYYYNGNKRRRCRKCTFMTNRYGLGYE
jgi:hypothetical protein